MNPDNADRKSRREIDLRTDVSGIAAEFNRVSMTIYGVHLLILQAGIVTKEHRERPTQHCGLLYGLRGEAEIRIDDAWYKLKPGKAMHCAYGQNLEMIVGAEEFEGVLVQYLPDKGIQLLSSLEYLSTAFELETGEDEGLFELLRKLCLISRQPMPTSAIKIKKLYERILKETFRLSRMEQTLDSRKNEKGYRADALIDELADRFNRMAFLVEDVIRMAIAPGQKLEGYSLPKNGFLFAIQGQATMSFYENEYMLEPGVICHGSEGEKMSLSPCSGEDFEYYLIHYRLCGQDEVFAEGIPKDFVLRPGLQPRIVELLERLHQTAVIPGKLTNFRKKELFMSILGEVFTACQLAVLNPRQLEAIERAIQYIHAHYAEPLTLEHLAQIQRMSTRQFSYLFHKNIGIRPIDYVLQYRISRAREMLGMSESPIGEIAMLVGYDDPQYFSRVFRRHTGMSPSEARLLSRAIADVDNRPPFIE
jgi:AraC-like DNA-binding protein/quercetin dioxygenase-like cupin family protein